MNMEDIITKKINEAQTLEDLALILKDLLSRHSVLGGQILEIKALVDIYEGLRNEIYPNEHPPPHFHVKASNIKASFAVEDCTLLEGSLNNREHVLIMWFHRMGREKLIEKWNRMRPTDCPVGPIPVKSN